MTFPLPIVQGGTTVFATGTVITLSSNTADYNLRNDLVNNYSWDGSSAIDVTLNISSGVNVRATGTGTAAITVNLVSGSNLTINNSGTIAARGGAGGGASNNSNGGTGGAGGNAIDLANVTSIIITLQELILPVAVEVVEAVVEVEEAALETPESGSCTGQTSFAGGGGGAGGKALTIQLPIVLEVVEVRVALQVVQAVQEEVVALGVIMVQVVVMVLQLDREDAQLVELVVQEVLQVKQSLLVQVLQIL